MLVKSINRSAVLSWSPKFEENSIVTCGSRKNLNSQLTSNSKLELFDLSSDKPIELLSIDIPSSFNRILWTSVEANRKDLIVGAFENGKVEVYDSQMLLTAESDGIVKVPDLHSGSVMGLCLSNFQPNLIASGSINGEIALWDLDNLGKASIINIEKSSKFGNVSDMSWNPKVPHIISVASDSGIVSIIDLRAKKEITTLSLQNENNRSSVSCIEWHPEISTNIIVCCDSKSQPFNYFFDLRSPGSASNVFKGHSDGVLSLSWCQKDPKMVLSSGRDGQTLCWNPSTNEVLKEYSHKGAFDVQWCPKDPNIFCVSTFGDGIIFQSINENSESIENDNSYLNPQWLNCPIGASFGGNNSCSIFRPNSQKIHLIKPKIDAFSEIYQDLIQFEYEMKHNNTKGIYENLIDCETDQGKKYIWKLVNLMGTDDICSKLLDLIEESFGEPDKCSYMINVPDLDTPSSNVVVPGAISFEIVDMIIRSDFEGAVMKCIELGRFSDALFISNYGDKELREKIENHVSQINGRFHLSLAKSIGRNEFESFVNTSPITQWKIILKVVCLHATPETLPSLTKIIFSRLVEQGMKRPALFVVLLTRDFDKILEIWLEIMYSNEFIYNADSDSCNRLIKTYKLLRILDYCCPNYAESLNTISSKTYVFEIVIKIKSLILSFGLDDTFIFDFQRNIFYHDHFKNKNTELDEFVESHLKNIALQTHHEENIPVIPSLVNSASNGYNQSFSSPTSPSIILPSYNQLSHSWQPSNIMYNDAPIVNLKLLKLSPQLGPQEINPETVQKALKCLSDAVNSKTVSDSTCRIIADCFRKLSKDLICSKEYSNISKTSIIALFEELSHGKIEAAASLTANIMASFFTETKDWILPVKRLIDIAKI